jgi:valyl-tRNA synthetase
VGQFEEVEMSTEKGNGSPSAPMPPTPERPALTPTRIDLGEELREQVEQAVKVGEEDAKQVHAVLEQFKKGVEKTLSKDDAAAHHDLGMAYMQMGLVDEAVRELNIAKKAEAKQGKGPAAKRKAAPKKKRTPVNRARKVSKRKPAPKKRKSAAKKAARKPKK